MSKGPQTKTSQNWLQQLSLLEGHLSFAWICLYRLKLKQTLFINLESTNTTKNDQFLIDRNRTHHWIHHWVFFRNATPQLPKLRGASGRRNLPPGSCRRIPLLEIPAEGGDFWEENDGAFFLWGKTSCNFNESFSLGLEGHGFIGYGIGLLKFYRQKKCDDILYMLACIYWFWLEI